MVAKARNCELGGEVGYHIGHSRKLSSSTKIVFKTAGVLWDEMLEKGVDALDYKAIILDGVHERSVESDLVIVCVKQFLLRNKNLRLVLMNIERYKKYFGDIGRDERVEVLAIPSSSQHIILYQRKVLYLDQITKLLGVNSELTSVEYCSWDSPSTAAANIKPSVQKLIFNLVLQIHGTEQDIEKSILIFLPTYRGLEQQWLLLKPLSSKFKVHILHSSIDIEEALMTMKLLKSHRKMILATNIAESSVTIPQVAFVIDSCRSLRVY